MNYWLYSFITFICAINLTSAYADEKTGAENYAFEIEYNISLPLCQDFKKILEAPENIGYIQKAPANLNPKSAWVKDQFENWRHLSIPEQYTNFKLLIWMDVPEDEAIEKLAHIINKRNEDKKFGIDYTFKKSRIDIDRDGYADTIYHRVGYSPGYFMELKNSALNQFFNRHGISFGYSQLIIYKGKPYFVYVGGPFRTGPVTILEPFSVYLKDAVNNNIVQEVSLKAACRYSTSILTKRIKK